MVKKGNKKYTFDEKKFKKSGRDAFHQDDRKIFVENMKVLAKK